MITFTQNLPTPFLMTSISPPAQNFKKLISPISPLEVKLMELEELKIGFNWGVPRFGHPEGKVGFHVKEVLDNISLLSADKTTLQKLRIAAIVHDAFKYKEAETIANGRRVNHGILARQFMESLIDDEITLDLIELHDEIYYAWRHDVLQGNAAQALSRLDRLIGRIGDNLRLHYFFFRCDTMTGDKVQAPRYWFEKKIKLMAGKDAQGLFDELNNLD